MNASDQTGKSRRASALAGWAKAITARFTRTHELRGFDRAEFEQIARDMNLAPPELYALLTGRRISAEALEAFLTAKFEVSVQLAKRLRAIERKHRVARIRASVPIGPSCC